MAEKDGYKAVSERYDEQGDHGRNMGISPDGYKFEGHAQRNQIHGLAKETYPDGRTLEGNYINGQAEGWFKETRMTD